MLEAWATALTWQQQLVLILVSPVILFAVIYTVLTLTEKAPHASDLPDRES
jgi:hypothetical protein